MKRTKRKLLEITPQSLLEFHDAATATMRELVERKNKNYSSGESGFDNGFENFNRVESGGLMSAEAGVLCRASDKWGRLVSYVHGGGSAEKAISDCFDVANYYIILAAMIEAADETKNETEAKAA